MSIPTEIEASRDAVSEALRTRVMLRGAIRSLGALTMIGGFVAAVLVGLQTGSFAISCAVFGGALLTGSIVVGIGERT